MPREYGENGCPYCLDGWGCPHEFILTEDGRIVSDFEHEVFSFSVQHIEETFNGLREASQPTPEWSNQWVNDLWQTASKHTALGERISILDLVGEEEIVGVLLEFASQLPQSSGERSMTRDDTPGLTGIGENYFCEDTEAATSVMKEMIAKALTPTRATH
jgi:hypothetical protein